MGGFAEHTRALMRERGVSLRELSRRTFYDSWHLSKVLSGRKGTSPELARTVDEALGAGGRLAALVPTPMDRDERLAYAARNPRRVDAGAVDALAAQLAAARRLEDAIGSEAMLPATVGQLRLVDALLSEARGGIRATLADVAAQWAQFAGWLHVNTDRHTDGARCYDQAGEWALMAGNEHMVATALSMKGHLAWTLDRPHAMIGLSQAAQRPGASPGVRALARQQEGRGHAIAGDSPAAEAALDEAAELAAAANEHLDDEPPWVYFFDPAYLSLQRGLALRYLARYGEAARLLLDGLAALPAEVRGTEWTAYYVGRLAATYTDMGEPGPACAAAGEAADTARLTRSRHLAGELHEVTNHLSHRWPGRGDIDELRGRLPAA